MESIALNPLLIEGDGLFVIEVACCNGTDVIDVVCYGGFSEDADALWRIVSLDVLRDGLYFPNKWRRLE